MKQAGKASFLTVVVCAVVVVGVVVVLFFTGGESPETGALKFMTALAEGDANTLTELSYMGDEPAEQVRKQWDFATNQASRYYTFDYQLEGSQQTDSNDAAVKISMIRDAAKSGAYPEDMSIPMCKVGSHWKVDVRAMNQEIYPDLPR